MNVLAHRLGVFDYAKVLAIVLLITSLWIMLVYPMLEPYLVANFMLSYAIFTVIYSAIVWYLMRNMDSLPANLLKSLKFFVMVVIILFVFDLLIFPYLITMDGILPNLSAGGLMSSDVFLFTLLPSALPAVIRYWFVYSLIPSILLAIVAVLSGTRKVFANVTARGV
jgi:hypothetical protein